MWLLYFEVFFSLVGFLLIYLAWRKQDPEHPLFTFKKSQLNPRYWD